MAKSSKNSPVSLDALIPREAFEIKDQQERNMGRSILTIGIRDLEQSSFFYPFLRKPDFQRETNEWDAAKICEFIESFLDGDLIPAVILWRGSSHYFVVDGSHRLSSLLAWINDDYGDGKISKLFYDGNITDEQKEAAKETRKLIKEKIGAYKDYQSLTSQGQVNPKMLERARNLGASAISLQWVEGDARKAEESFFKINQKAAPISETEMRLLLARKTPNGVAARAVVRSGNGHKYWSDFSEKKQDEIETVAQEIHQLIFQPQLSNPIKTLDVPIVGNLSSSDKLELILEFINIVNNISTDNQLGEDSTGDKTLELLKKCKKVAQRINSSDPSSLGLHPIVYFYTQQGKPKIGSFYGVVSLILNLEQTKSWSKLIKVRKDFEWVIWNYDMVPQLVAKKSDALQARELVRDFYLEVINKLSGGIDKKNAIAEIRAGDKRFATLKISKKADTGEIQSKEFSRETKASAFIRDAIPGCPVCKICGGYLPSRFNSIDHITRKADGGLGTLKNAQLTHPYCNTTYKN
jgi:hypothetical protein